MLEILCTKKKPYFMFKKRTVLKLEPKFLFFEHLWKGSNFRTIKTNNIINIM